MKTKQQARGACPTMNIFRSTVQENLSDIVLGFCQKVSPRSTPHYVPVIPEPFCKFGYCFQNVEQKISRKGGTIEYGWQIWICPNVFVEAEFHAVWKGPDQSYIDITPPDGMHSAVLFIPDGRKKYEGYRTDNIRQNISTNPLVDLFIEISSCIFLVQTHNEKPYDHHTSLRGDELEIAKYLYKWVPVVGALIEQGFGKNSPCPCGANDKFKHCCQKDLLTMIAHVKSNYATLTSK